MTYRLIFAQQTNFQNLLIWEIYLDDIELLVGMLAAGIGIIEDLNTEATGPTNPTNPRFYLDTDADVSTFRLQVDVPEDNLRTNSLGKLASDQYGLWLKGSKQFYYSLYAFRTNSFFQGIISIATTFGVDFRNYLYGFPFDHLGSQYALSNYIMAPQQIGVDAPDIDDIEEQEESDENINEPLARTEDIITITSEGVVTPA